MKVYAIEINNLSTGSMIGSCIKQGCLNLKVDRMPVERVYRQYGRFYISNTGGVWSFYEEKEGTTRGFAGREIVLAVEGQGTVFSNKGITYKKFNGSLWDTAEALQLATELAGDVLVSVGIRAANDRCDVYCSYSMSLKQLHEKIGHLIIFNNPSMNPMIEF